jgi:hypothetical protein
MGARTVAGEIVTVPMVRLLGTGSKGTASRAVPEPFPELSQNFFICVEGFPQGLKPFESVDADGTTEVVPYRFLPFLGHVVPVFAQEPTSFYSTLQAKAPAGARARFLDLIRANP